MNRNTASREEIEDYIYNFEQVAKVDVFRGTRQRDITETRYLLYYLLNTHLDLSDTYIALLCSERGLDRKRSSINIGYNRAMMYVKQSARLKGIYREIHPEKFKKKVVIKKKEESPADSLDLLVKSIPYERRKEVHDRVKMQIASWSWK
tara:strand:+ start:42 stop:488 length:447 start_codon:yes stop_codon:yes gene_type:complete